MTGIDREERRQADRRWERIEPTLHGRYAFVRWLGAGAHGDVCEAIQQSTGQQVAIKLLRAPGHPTVQTRFVREMRTCAALRHPNIVRVLDAGCAESADAGDRAPLFTVFEYVPGETLEQLLAREGTLTVASTFSLMVQVLEGLQAAHELGIVHRDLKPTNIMVTQTSTGLRAKILDFGVAGVIAGERETAALTQTGESVGTPAYCAPEQLRGEAPDPRMDFYAWGLVFLECLTGQRTFLGSTLAEILHAQLSPSPVPLPRALTGHRLGTLLRWVLEKNPARRIPEVRSLGQELARIDCSALVDRSGFLSVGDTYEPSVEAPTTELGANMASLDQRRFATALCFRIDLLEPLPVALEESYDEWLSDTRNQVVEVCRRYNGTLAGSTASELTFYFGLAPGEGASVMRGARSALELRDMRLRSIDPSLARETASLDGAEQTGPRVGVRIGLHQGRVTINSQQRDGSPIPGALALRAAQLCASCGPGEIAISQEAFAAARGSVRVSDAGQPHGALLLVSLAQPEPGGSAHGLVGRAYELEQLRRAWDDSSVRLVALCGAPGIGKSHLALAWNQIDAQAPSLLRVGRCLPGMYGTTLAPVAELLRARFAAGGDEALATIEGLLQKAGFDTALALSLIAPLAGLRFAAGGRGRDVAEEAARSAVGRAAGGAARHGRGAGAVRDRRPALGRLGDAGAAPAPERGAANDAQAAAVHRAHWRARGVRAHLRECTPRWHECVAV